MIENYSERTLSMPSDKFPGLSRLASEFASILDDQYVAGPWRKDFCRDLCWRWKPNDTAHRASQTTKKMRMMEYAPSWSWAKMIVPVSYELAFRRSLLEEMRTEIDLATLDPLFLDVNIVPERKDLNLVLLSATIALEGYVFRVSVQELGIFRY